MNDVFWCWCAFAFEFLRVHGTYLIRCGAIGILAIAHWNRLFETVPSSDGVRNVFFCLKNDHVALVKAKFSSGASGAEGGTPSRERGVRGGSCRGVVWRALSPLTRPSSCPCPAATPLASRLPLVPASFLVPLEQSGSPGSYFPKLLRVISIPDIGGLTGLKRWLGNPDSVRLRWAGLRRCTREGNA